MSSEDELATERWNELLEDLTEKEIEWLSSLEDHNDEVALHFFALDDFVTQKLVTPTGGACLQLERLIIKMRKKRNAADG